MQQQHAAAQQTWIAAWGGSSMDSWAGLDGKMVCLLDCHTLESSFNSHVTFNRPGMEDRETFGPISLS